MKCLVVITHPLRDSLYSFLGEHVVARLKAQGHEVDVENLYESGFNPLLAKNERSSYYSPQGGNSACLSRSGGIGCALSPYGNRAVAGMGRPAYSNGVIKLPNVSRQPSMGNRKPPLGLAQQ